MTEQLYDGRILVRLEEWYGRDCYDRSLFAAPPNLASEEQVQAAIERAFEEVLEEDAERDEDDDDCWTHDDLHRRLLGMGFTEVPYITWDYELWKR